MQAMWYVYYPESNDSLGPYPGSMLHSWLYWGDVTPETQVCLAVGDDGNEAWTAIEHLFGEAALAQDEEEDVTEASKRSAPEDCGCIGGVATVIAGVKTPSEVERAVAMMNVSIPKAFWTELKSAGLLPHTAPTP